MNEPKPNPAPDLTTPASSISPVTGTGSDTLGVAAAGAGSDVPSVIGGYVLLSELGRGGMGVVYRAEDRKLKRDVAIKLMLPQFAANPQAKARFIREARSQAKVEHEHVAVIHGVDEHQGLPYLVMPLLKGMTLQAALKANPRPPLNEVIRIGREMAEGLAAAHEKGLVHRDIKPANIWLEGKKLRVKVLDFGLARVADTFTETEHSETGPVTAEGGIVGTPAYMSPEQARGDDLDGRTDLWSLGVVLYQMTTGELPFTGKNAMAVLARVGMHNPPPPSQVNPSVPPSLSDVVMRLLAKNPDQRQPTAEAVVDDLRAVEAGLVNAVRVIPLGAPPPIIVADVNAGTDPFADLDATEANSGEAVPEAEIAEPQPARQAARVSKRGGFPVWAMVAGVLLAVGAIVGIVASQMGKPPVEVAKEEPQPTPPRKEPKKDVLPADPERAAAEYVLGIGGRVTIAVNDQDRGIAAVGELPKEPFRLHGLHLGGNTQVSDAGLANFKECKNLTLIEMGGVQVSDAGLTNFKHCKNLTHIDLRNTKVSDVGFANFKDCKNLTYIEFGATEVSDAGLEYFKDCNELTHLDLHTTKASDAGLKNFKDCKNLTTLSLYNTQVSDAGLVYFKNCKGLQALDLCNTQVGDTGLTHFKECNKLAYLKLENTQLGDAGLEQLKELKSLRTLSLRMTKVSGEGVKALAAALPRCQITWEKGTLEPSDVHFHAAQRWVADGGSVTVKLANGQTVGVPEAALPDEPFTLTGVSRPGQTTDEFLKRLAAIPTLTSAYLPHSTFSPEALRAILNSRETLTYLHMRNRVLTEELIEVILRFQNLRSLELPDTGMTDSMLKTLAGLTNLVTLSIHDNPISDASIETLAGMKQLTDLYLERTRVTKAGYEKLKSALPKCNVRWEDPTRAIVTRFLTRGAIISLRGADGKDIQVQKAEQLPAGPLTVTVVHLSVFSQWTDTDMLWLESLANPHLKRVSFYGENKVTAAGLRSLLTLKDSLTDIHLYGNLSPEGAKVVGQLNLLEGIGLDGMTLSESQMRHLVAPPRLRVLELPRCDLTDKALAELTRSKTVVQLTLSATLATDAGVEPLAGMKQLTSLNLIGTRVTEAGLDKLKAALPGSAIAWEEPERNFAKWALNRGAIVLVLELPDGKEVRPTKAEELPDGAFTVTAVSCSSRDLAPFGDADIRQLGLLRNLKSFRMTHGHKVTVEGFQRLAAHKDTLTHIDLSDGRTVFTDEGTKVIGQLSKLKSLGVGSPSITDAGVAPLAGLDELNHVRFFDFAPIGDAGLGHLARMKNLHMLFMPGSRVTDAGLEQLPRLKALRDLDLSGSAVTDAGLKHLAEIKSLLTLGLSNTIVSDAGVPVLASMKSLVALDLNRTRVTEAGVKQLKAALPNCVVNWSPRATGLRFEATSDLQIPNFAIDLSQPVTFEAYVTPSEEMKSAQVACIHSANQLSLGWEEGKWQFRVYLKGAVTHPAVVGKRTHLAGVFENNTIRLYVDGKLAGSKTLELDAAFLKEQQQVGLAWHFPGTLAEVRVSKVARYDKDFTPAERFATDKDTLALYHLDEGTPGEVRDSSGNNRHGKIAGATWVYPDGSGEPKKP